MPKASASIKTGSHPIEAMLLLPSFLPWLSGCHRLSGMVSTDNSSHENFDGAVGELMINIRYYVFLLWGFLAMGLGMMIELHWRTRTL